MSQQSLRQASIRAVTSTALDYNGDWSARFDAASIPAGDWNGRLLAWLNAKMGSSHASLPAAQAAFAAAQSTAPFSSIGTFNAS